MSTFNARALLLLAPLALAGCSQAASDLFTNSSDPASDTVLAPGRWELTAATDREQERERAFGDSPPITPRDAPSPEPTTKTVAVCITPALANKFSPDLLASPANIGACSRNYWSATGGTISGDFDCPNPRGLNAPLHVAGTYSRERFEIEITGQQGGASVTEKLSGERRGECDGSEQRPGM